MPGLTDKQINQILSEFAGQRVRLGYRGGAGVGPLGTRTSTPQANMGTANANVGRIHLLPSWYRSIAARKPSPSLALAMGILAHELGHLTPENQAAQRGTLNATGGLDKDPRVWEEMADKYGMANLRRLYNAFGYRPHMARALTKKSIAALKRYREEHPY